MSTADETRYGKKEPPYEAVLGQMVTVREAGIERRLTAAEAFTLVSHQTGARRR